MSAARLAPLSIGPVRLDPPLVLAPMAGVTDLAMRLLCREQGAGLVCNEFISGYGLFYGNSRSQEYLRFEERERPVSCQIFGADPERLAVAAKQVEQAGADLLDLNLGCSVPKVVRTGAGAALLQEPPQVGRLVASLVAAVRCPVTVKMRLGWHSRQPVGPEIARICEDSGAQMIAVHGRFGCQGYRGLADYEAIGAVKAAVTVPVIGNGDVRGGADAARLLAQSGCDGVMVGRAAEGNPWIFGRLATYLRDGREPPPPSLAERLATARRHGELMLEYKSPERTAREMRRHLAAYTAGLPGASALRVAVNQAPDWDTMVSLLRQFGEQLVEVTAP